MGCLFLIIPRFLEAWLTRLRRASTENNKLFVGYGLGFFAAGSGFN
jgi:hypothetical protein